MTQLCAITGPVRDRAGNLLANQELRFFYRGGVVGSASGALVPKVVTAITSAAGQLSVSLYSGLYRVEADTENSRLTFNIGVPDAPTATFSDLIEENPAITSDLLAQTVAARDVATTAATASESARDEAVAAASSVVSVKSAGAEGDGSTDDTAAFTTAAGTANRTVIIPPGTYVLENWTIGASNITFVGYGNPTLIVKAGATSGPMLVSVANRANLRFEGITFDGNVSGVSSFNNVVQTFQSTDIVFENCTFQNCRGIALLASSGERTKAINCRFLDCGTVNRTTSNSADRRQAFAATNNPECEAIGCYFENVGLDCISYATNSHRSKAIGNTCISNDAGTIYVTSDLCVISDNYVSNGAAGGNAIDLYTAESCTVSGNVCVGNGAAGILVADCKDISVTGNVCKNNWQSGTSVHRGGITFAATDGGVCEQIVVSGNRCFDDQATKTQRHAIGVYKVGSGAFSDIVISKSNALSGYDASGNLEQLSVFQNSQLGLVGHGFSVNLADGAEIALYPATQRARGTFFVHELNGGHMGVFGMRLSQTPRELIDADGTFEVTDTGTETAVYINSGTVFLKNRTGAARSYYLDGGEPATV